MRPPISGVLLITQLFGGNPAVEAYTRADGIRVLGHTGIDVACPLGTQIFAAWDGVLRVRDTRPHGLGLFVEVRDGRGRIARYGHLSRGAGAGRQCGADAPRDSALRQQRFQ